MRAMRAGVQLFVLVFAAGFALGALRVLVLAPRWGAEAARLAELPLMVALSALFARLIVRRHGLRRDGAALACGVIAFLLLQAGELTLAEGLAPGGASGYCADILTPVGALAFAAQALLLVLPWLAAGDHADEHP